jgi:succinate dehydrogenase / fumarate reductase cytochrome b subunit
MSTFRRVFSSSVGTKLLIGLTGLALFLYLILHLIGNLMILVGPETFNGYAHMLISNPLVVPVEIGLLLIFLLHVYKTVVNYFSNQAARPVGYAKKEYAGHTSRKTVASSTMIFSGLLTFLFVIIHVKQFKYGTWYETAGVPPIRDLARLEIEVFSQPVWVAFYAICTIVVGFHLRHGIASGFQSIGFDHPTYARRLFAWALALSIIIGGGLALIPIVVHFTH